MENENLGGPADRNRYDKFTTSIIFYLQPGQDFTNLLYERSSPTENFVGLRESCRCGSNTWGIN